MHTRSVPSRKTMSSTATPKFALGLPAPAKLNIFLHVVGRREDGYHLLQSAMLPIDLADSIDVEVLGDDRIVRDGDIVGSVEQDLCVRAAALLQRHSGCRLGARIDVRKRIPAGAGLGGGSSDAATTLLALNRLWRIDLGRAELAGLALRLGADVPFFIHGTPAFVEGIGERITPLPSRLLENCRTFALVHPQVHVSTQEIFSSPGLTRNTKPTTILGFSASGLVGSHYGTETAGTGTQGCGDRRSAAPVADGAAGSAAVFGVNEFFGVNDLEAVARHRFPEVDRALALLGQFGPARMSGSGSAVFVWVPDARRAQGVCDEVRSLQPDWRGWAVQALNEHPLRDWVA
jgi:4-diphosphocytidyl-2-C-methyl-D-erythritol kinase